ncbi:sugar isomerase [Halobacteriovorax marinus]|uniref:D-sedoheptulose-7-phosphate isomerase n=1 Tax=Halobacteriovorax marinus TaxID=97084 RepID=UPI000BC2EB82|nr:SIS domain-containing protein [Halobacteriovorax marinus]ATH06746.1 sugar isomerase [Halobacteriovorax marinus]
MYSENHDPAAYCKSYINYLTELLQGLDFEAIASFIDEILKTRDHGSKILFIGNGGSAATASHFANDISIGTREYERPFKAMSLSDNIAILTAISNDDGYEEVFKKQLQVHLDKRDIVVAISASGNSENLVRAIQYAKEKGNKTIGLLGFDGGKLKELCDQFILIPTAQGEYGPVEDIHMILDHMIGSYLFQYIQTKK